MLKRSSRKQLKVAVKLEEPVAAPIAKGTQIGTLVVSAPDMQSIDRPLIAGEDVAPLGAMGRLKAAIGHLIWGAGQ